MSGASVTADIDVSEARAALARLSDDQLQEMLASIGTLIENQTKHRIEHEKRSPDGDPWDPWSQEYALTRHGGHSLLRNEDHLRYSIGWQLHGDEVMIGTEVPYGATHQFGRDGIPARPYLGLSGENREEIERLVVGSLEGLLA